jgi:hypothetical protein
LHNRKIAGLGSVEQEFRHDIFPDGTRSTERDGIVPTIRELSGNPPSRQAPGGSSSGSVAASPELNCESASHAVAPAAKHDRLIVR